MLEERLLVCRLFTGLTLELVPMVSIQVPAEILSVQQIFPLSLLPWQAPWEKAQYGTMKKAWQLSFLLGLNFPLLS